MSNKPAGGGMFREMIAFARQNKLYWIIPLTLLALLALLVLLGDWTDSPFHYRVF